jgi:hypothetical protein
VITIVSGIPRSGTSLTMQMLAAGGMPVLTDGVRNPDVNNPRGYYEWDPIRALQYRPEVIVAAEGKAVKVISSLLQALSHQYTYRVIFMCRPLEEIVTSQNKMLHRLGKDVPERLAYSALTAFQQHLQNIREWLSKQSNMVVLWMNYAAILEEPERSSLTISGFLSRPLKINAMVKQVEQSLHRERTTPRLGFDNS